MPLYRQRKWICGCICGVSLCSCWLWEIISYSVNITSCLPSHSNNLPQKNVSVGLLKRVIYKFILLFFGATEDSLGLFSLSDCITNYTLGYLVGKWSSESIFSNSKLKTDCKQLVSYMISLTLIQGKPAWCLEKHSVNDKLIRYQNTGIMVQIMRIYNITLWNKGINQKYCHLCPTHEPCIQPMKTWSRK